jgi:hypothetical protein
VKFKIGDRVKYTTESDIEIKGLVMGVHSEYFIYIFSEPKFNSKSDNWDYFWVADNHPRLELIND